MTSIDHVTVISLDRTPDRFAAFVEMNPHLPIRRFPGIDGQLLDRWDCVDEGLITPGNPYTLRSLGSGLSHIRLWQTCVAEGRAIHIAEDDAIFRHDFIPMASSMLASLDLWDIVVWGWNFDWPMEAILADGLGSAVFECNEKTLRSDWTAFPPLTGTPVMLRLVSNTGIWAYSLSPRGAKDLLQRSLPIAGKPGLCPARQGTFVLNQTLDVEMTRHYGSINAFVSVPCLAVSLNVKSDSVV